MKYNCIRSVAALTALVATACAQTDSDVSSTDADSAAIDAAAVSLTSIADVGLQTPESVLYDEQADIYLVSNINGEPAGKANNGFISRIRATGEVDQLKWIDGAADGITLHAPKGMGLRGDTLFVADIDTVRAFHRTSGQPLGALGASGATFLNDIAIGANGTLYVTDTGIDASFAPTGGDAIYQMTQNGLVPFFAGEALMRPNGIVTDADHIYVVTFGGNAVLRFPLGGGEAETIATLPAGQLDGIVRTSDGTLLVSSWEGSAIYRIAPDGQVSTAVEDLEAPADLGWDSRRRRLLIPLFNGNRIEIREVH